MFDLLRKTRGPRPDRPPQDSPRQDSLRPDSPRQVARERVQSAIRRDRNEVTTKQLSQLRADLLATISHHLPVDGDFAEFGLYRDGDEVFLVSRVRLHSRR